MVAWRLRWCVWKSLCAMLSYALSSLKASFVLSMRSYWMVRKICKVDLTCLHHLDSSISNLNHITHASKGLSSRSSVRPVRISKSKRIQAFRFGTSGMSEWRNHDQGISRPNKTCYLTCYNISWIILLDFSDILRTIKNLSQETTNK